MMVRLQQILLAVAAGLAAQGIGALWRWLREPALPAQSPVRRDAAANRSVHNRRREAAPGTSQ
jgi:hypothetical protein